ncbi:MAG: site-specific integrase [Deltaproteobacteria bacterium]|nr:site-specific integrase [Deltaproteobacteria bacterium]
MGLYRRKDSPLWWMSFRFTGGRVRESTGTDNRKLAERIHAKRTLEVAEGRHFSTPLKTAAAQVPFSELAERYESWAERQRSFKSKKCHIKSLAAAFGGLHLGAVTTHLCESYQSRLLSEGKKAATANRRVACLKHMFTKADEWELADEAALRRVQRVKLLPEHNKRLRFLSREESAALIASCDAHLKPIVITALNTGMRKEEILSLEWGRHVDLKHGFILLDVTKNGERREVPMNETVKAALKGLLRRIDSPYVFTNNKGKRFKNVKRSFTSACRRAGIKDFRIHDLRHTFASQLIMAGADLTTVKELLGHKSLSMTLRYAHLAPSHKLKAVEMLDAGHVLVTLGDNRKGAVSQTP